MESATLDKSFSIFGINSRPAVQTVEDEDEIIISASMLFDEDWYLRTNPDVAQSSINPLRHYILYGVHENRSPFKGFDAARYVENVSVRVPVRRNPLAHYFLHGHQDDLIVKGQLQTFSIEAIKGAMTRLQSLPFFRSEDYLKLHPDAKAWQDNEGVLPAQHALAFGFTENCRVFMPTTVARVMGEREGLTATPVQANTSALMLPPIGVFCSSGGDLFSHQFAADLVLALGRSAESIALLDENADIETRPSICIFVSPHEFFYSGRGLAWVREDVLKEAFLFNVEPPNSIRFERGLLYGLIARAIIDISWPMANAFAKAGIPAFHFTPPLSRAGRWLHDTDLDHPLVRILSRQNRKPVMPFQSFDTRKIDISFFSTHSEHREKFLAKNARFLAQYDSFLYCPKSFPTTRPDDPRECFLRLAAHVTSHSKIFLNLLCDLPGFCDWQTFIKIGISAGAVIVSEPCEPHPVFKTGVHFLTDEGRHLTNLIEWLLRTPEGRVKALEVQSNCLAIQDSKEPVFMNRGLADFIRAHAKVSGPS